MVRNFLGNIRGPRGTEGPKGEDGGFNGEKIGVTNLIDLTELITFDANANIEIDIENGVINYSNSSYYMRNIKTLRKGNYNFTVKDYTSHSDSFGGKLRFQVVAVDGSGTLFSNDADKRETYSFNVVEDKEYYIELRATGGTRKDGFIEKPMLVEGEYVSNFQLSEKDRFNLNSLSTFSNYRMFESGFSNGVEKTLRAYFNDGDRLENVDNGLVLEQGSWMVSWNFQSVTDAPGVTVKLLLDDEEIARGVTDTGYYSLSIVVHVPQGTSSRLSFTVTPPNNSNLTMGADRRNNTQIKKL